MGGTLAITGDEHADDLLNTNGTALLIGMLLDQQVPMEWAFRGPATLEERLGGVDAAAIAARDVDEVVAVCCAKPAIHRFPAAMGRRIHALCRVIVDQHGGDGARVWSDRPDASTLWERIRAFPGFGEEKSRIFMALLAKRHGVRPDGWERFAGPFADDVPRSAADVEGPDSLSRVREWKRAQKAAGKGKQD
ncbi:HhH-GPD-type base excision DNA repair protein [soil metagenome]